MDTETAPQSPEIQTIEEQVIATQPTIEPQPVSHTKQIIIVSLIILLLIGAGLYLFVINPGLLNMFSSKQNNVVEQSQVVPSPSVVASNIDSSDPQIDKDIQALNSKINGLDTDFNGIDNGLDDVPVDTIQ